MNWNEIDRQSKEEDNRIAREWKKIMKRKGVTTPLNKLLWYTHIISHGDIK